MSQAPPRGERRLVTVLFADLTAFTSVTESMDPEDVDAFLQPLMEDMTSLVESHGGTMVNWIGDGFLAVFGVPTTHADDAERAVRAAMACRDAVKARATDRPGWEGPTSLHAGIHTGEVLVVPRRGGLDVVGDTVNTASRLLGVAPAGCVLVGSRTRDLTDHVTDYLEWAPIRLKGKAEAVQAYQVRSISAEPGGRPSRAAPTAFVGRAIDLTWLRQRLAEVTGWGHSTVAIIAGPPGLGKSRLAAEFAETAGEARHLVGRCQAYGERGPWHAIADALRGFVGIQSGADPDAVRAALSAAVAEALPDVTEPERSGVAGWLATVAGVGSATTPPGPAELNLDLAVAVRRFLSGLATNGPVVVTLEDVQWADPQLFGFLSWVVEEPWPAPVLFLCAGWPEVLERGELKLDDDRVLHLRALSTEECASMLAGLLPGEVPERLRSDLMRRSGGNPLYLEETVHMLREGGALRADAGRWSLRGETAAIPETMQLVVAARIDGLPEPERRLLRDASVAGETFWDGSLRALGWRDGVEELLERLIERDLIRVQDETTIEGARQFGFKHAVIRDVAYATLPRADRAAKHLAIAGWVRASLYPGSEEPVELLAFHYAQSVALNPGVPGHTVRLAVDYLHRAGDRARMQFAWVAAAAQYTHALTLAERLDPDPRSPEGELLAEVRLAQAEALSNLSRYEDARTEATEVLALAEQAGRRDWRARALLVLGWVESDVPNEARARELLGEAVEIARELGDRRAEAVALFETAYTWRFADFGRHQESLERAARAFRAVGDYWWELRCYQDLAWGATPQGGEAFERPFRRLDELTLLTAEPRAVGALRRAWGYFRFYAGDLAAASEVLGEAVGLGLDVGDPDVEVESRYPLALADLAFGRLDTAEAHADRIARTGERRRFRRVMAQGKVLRARIASRRGDAGTADRELAEAESLLHELGAGFELVEVWGARAEIGLDRGDPELAEAGARRFAEDLRQGGALWRPYALTLLGQARLLADDLAGARGILQEARSEAEAIGNVLVPVRTALLLAEIDALDGRDPGPLPAELPTPTDRALHAEIRALRGDASGWADATEAWSELGVTAWPGRSRDLARR